MTELSLRAGQTLRIRGGSGLLLVLRPAAPCKVRVVKRGAALRIGRAILACWLRLHRFSLSAARARR